MYDLTIFSLMRDSLGYFNRYIEQVNAAFDHFKHCRLVICEGDSIDGTKERLAQIASDGDGEVHADVTVITMDQGNLPLGNADHPGRWHFLEHAWNTNLSQLEPTKYAVCVESDLIWDWPILKKMIDHLEAGRGDVMLPMLMRDTPITGKYFYDCNAYRLHHIHFGNYKPYHPDWKDGESFMQLDTGGGLLVMRGETLSKAVWKHNCVLHYRPGTKVTVDTTAEIYHP